MFNPYERWLGIVEERRPLTPHQLLGVSPHESDPRVLEAAAVARTAEVRRHQIRYPEHCTRLLNEIAHALTACLEAARRTKVDRAEGRRPTRCERRGRAGELRLTAYVLPPAGPDGEAGDCSAWRVRVRPVRLSPAQRRKLEARRAALRRSGRDGSRGRIVLRAEGGGPARKFVVPAAVWEALLAVLGGGAMETR
ncbi:MAG TPA: hypothetical protein VFA26_11625 [Gemmataceae bacterium]|nr:hypothetical protein [Gemmataceae bacterium]